MRDRGKLFTNLYKNDEVNLFEATKDMFILMYIISRNKEIHKEITKYLLELDQRYLKKAGKKATGFEYKKHDDYYLFDSDVNWNYIAPVLHETMLKLKGKPEINEYMEGLKEGEYLDFFKWLESIGLLDVLEYVKENGL